jgi:hypothetical protein
MTSNNIESVYTAFKENFDNKPEFTIDFYTNNSVFFNSIILNTTEELRLYIEMTWQYLNAIYSKKSFAETLDKINNTLPFINSEIDRLNATNLKDEWYGGILQFKGMASYKLTHYKTATNIFIELLKLDSNNEIYKKTYQYWLKQSQYKQWLKLLDITVIINVILMFISIFFKKSVANYFMRQVLFYVPFFLLIVIGILGYYIKHQLQVNSKYIGESL